MSSTKKTTLRSIYNSFRRKRLARIKNRFRWTVLELEIKNEAHKKSHSLMWVWEFSKKAVLVCFIFYMIVQVYAMTVMVTYQDFTSLGELIYQTGEIVRECVFAYLIKAGIENICKIFWSKRKHNSEDHEFVNDSEEPVG